MTILIDGSLKCNLNCTYCYNKYLREHVKERIDVEAIKASVKKIVDLGWSKQITLHGGEPTFWDREVLEELLSFSYKMIGHGCLQTNGTLIDTKLIDMFKKYKTSIGLSIDGPNDLNKYRCDEKLTSKIIENIYLLKKEGIGVGVIMVIHKANGLPEQRSELKQFILDLDHVKINGRLNPCLFPSKEIELTISEAKDFYLDMAKFMEAKGISGWSPFQDMINSLLGKKEVVCTFNGCDPYATSGGVVVTSDGKVTVCHKFHKERLAFTNPQSNLRIKVLANIDCKGCRYFPYCKGGCPANAVNNDWRNKTRWCPVWKVLWSHFEKGLKFMGFVPVTKKEQQRITADNHPHEDHWENVR